MHIVRVFTFFLIVTAAYGVFMAVKKPIWMEYPEHQWHGNLIKVEKFLTQEHTSNVLVGSSLSNRIDMTTLGEDWFNLALDGQSVYDGLATIKLKELKPKRVFVEINVIDRFANQYFHETLSNPFKRKTNAVLPIFNATSRPSTWLREYLEFHIVKRLIPLPQPTGSQPTNNAPRDLLIKQAVAGYQELLDPDEINIIVQTLSESIGQIEEECEIIFYELPTNQFLCNEPRSIQYREIIKEHFPNIPFIESPPCDQYETTDEVHLDKESGNRYARYLKSRA